MDLNHGRTVPAGSLGGLRVLVVGLARQGVALARYFVREGAHVTVTDRQPPAALAEPMGALADLPIRLALGGHSLSLLEGTDLVCLSAGVPLDIPLAKEARRRAIRLTNDTLLTLERSPATVVGITGSSGKTTTTVLMGLMLEAGGIRTHVGGNIGTPLLDRLHEHEAGDWAVLELSSFQLELFDSSPPVAGVTNITPNHLDRHRTMSEYTATKASILRWQSESDACVLSADDRITGRWLRSGWVDIPADEGSAPWSRGARLGWSSFPIGSARWGFSLSSDQSTGAFLRAGELILRQPGQSEVAICRKEDLRLRGMHNVANVLAAACLACLAGTPPEAMAQVATTFQGVEHRLEIVLRLGGVLWVNDSIATSPERAAAALASFREPIVLLAGGRDKNLVWDDFAQHVHRRVEHLLIFGEASDLIAEAIERHRPTAGEETLWHGQPLSLVRCADLEEAVAVASGLAHPGDVVLLAPGGTSFDMYRDFAARGVHFRTLVNELGE